MDRRTFLSSGAGALATSLAGCSGGSDDETATTGEPAGTDTATPTSQDTGYSVNMAPVGAVTFEEVPQTWESYFPDYADMGVALGQAEGLTAVGNKPRYYTSYYDELDGVSLDTESLTQLLGDGGIDKEIYLELDNDVHITDPQWLINNSFFGLEESDIQQITDSVGPFVGNTIFRRTDTWHDYRYYTMYEAFEKVAQVFGKADQYAAFKSFHDDVLADVQTNLPPADQRPNGLLCFAASDEPKKFSPYRLTDKGTNKKHFRNLGVSDALAGTGIEGLSTTERGKIDYETMLEVDPDALFVRGHETKTREEFENSLLSFMREHDVASELAAVQEGRVYRGGPIYQGPIQNLFLTERFATLLYPDAYSGELFDRGEVASIIRGEF